MFCSIISATICGIEPFSVAVETNMTEGMPVFEMVGCLGSEVREAKERVRAALKNMNIVLPPKRITINIAPTDMRKSGSAFDLPIALGILCTMGYIKQESLEHTMILGELSLNGRVNAVKGVLPVVILAKEAGMRRCLVPEGNVNEGSMTAGIEVIGIKSLEQCIAHLSGDAVIKSVNKNLKCKSIQKTNLNMDDFADVSGQMAVKRSAEVAVAGRHHLLLIGPPGSGKTMIASRLPGIMPKLNLEECLEVSKIYSISGMLQKETHLIQTRPFINPHYTVSASALAGGGKIPHPGLVSLSHKGVLFLDELTEFTRETLEVLRQPLEEKIVRIARVTGNYSFPADFMLCAACNPCPCGYYPDFNRCTCSEAEITRYLNKLSGPLFDRIDICMETTKVTYDMLQSNRREESSSKIRKRIERAVAIQKNRFKLTKWNYNSEIAAKDIKKYCPMDRKAEELLKLVYHKHSLSARGYHKLIRVARTIADLDGSEMIEGIHISEAAAYRLPALRR